MKNAMLISSLAGLILTVSPAMAEPTNIASGATVLSETEMDNIVAGETIEMAQFLKTGNILGYIPGLNLPYYRQIDMSGLPDQGAQKMLSGEGPNTNGTVSFHDQEIRPGVPIYNDVTRVGVPSGGHAAAFVTVYRISD